MAAQNVTAAALLNVQARLQALFNPEAGPSQYEKNSQIDVQAARAVLENHIADTSPITAANGDCRGFEAFHLVGRSDTLFYDDDGDDLTLDCDIPSGDGVTAVKTTYDLNLRKVVLREVNDDLCGNLFQDSTSDPESAARAATLVAENLMHGLMTIHRSLSIDIINFLDANKTPTNNDGSLPSGITFSGSDEFEIDETILSTLNPDTLTEVETIVQNNDLTSWFILAGRNHYRNAAINSQWNVLNDDQRSEVRWAQTGIFFDQKHLDAELTGKNSFVIDPASFLFYAHADERLTATPRETHPDFFVFYLDDPILRVNGPRGLQPVRYTVHYQKICSGINNSTMLPNYDHRFRILLNAGLHPAPAAADGHTGILKFVSA
jgi:hypothetical protein